MKNRRFTPMLIAAGLLSAINFGTAFAQPETPTPPKTNKKAPRAPRKPAVPKRLLTAIEAKTGKPITDEQRLQLSEAVKARQEAMKAATETYLAAAAKITGLTIEELREVNKPANRGAAGAAKPPVPNAPVANPAPGPRG